VGWDGEKPAGTQERMISHIRPNILGRPNGLSAGFITAEQLGAASIRASGFKVNW
jgi:hypothetical protein